MKRIINYKEKGITLVALVITIIILLILAGVTLNTALSENGLFKMAKKAVNEYQESEKQEQSALEDIAEEMDKISIDYNEYVGCYVEGYEPTKRSTGSEFTITSETSGVESNTDSNGNTIGNGNVEANGEQKFTTENLGWRIWDYDKNTKIIRLISDKPTEKTLALEGATGYNNGVWAINEVCRQCYGQYDENNEMKRGISVANLRRTDIQKVSTYDYKNYKHIANNWEENQAEGTVYFGSSKTTYNAPKYPEMWAKYDSNWAYEYDGTTETGSDKECEIWERENGNGKMTGEETGIADPIFKQSGYYHTYLDHQDQFINQEYYNLLFKNGDNESYFGKVYWLSGRFVHLYVNNCIFGIQFVGSNSKTCGVRGIDIYNSFR